MSEIALCEKYRLLCFTLYAMFLSSSQDGAIMTFDVFFLLVDTRSHAQKHKALWKHVRPRQKHSNQRYNSRSNLQRQRQQYMEFIAMTFRLRAAPTLGISKFPWAHFYPSCVDLKCNQHICKAIRFVAFRARSQVCLIRYILSVSGPINSKGSASGPKTLKRWRYESRPTKSGVANEEWPEILAFPSSFSLRDQRQRAR